MARLNTYTQDGSVTGSDKVLGTDAASGVTKNFSLNSVSDWINDAGAVKIVGQNNYTFQAEGPLPADRRVGTISFQDFGGDGTLFADVTELIFSNASAGNNNAAQYLSSLVGKQVILADLSELANYGVYTLQSFQELDTEPGFYRGTLLFVSGTGALYDAVAYGFAAEGLQAQGGTWGSITGTITDQTDLVDYVDAEIAAIPTPETPTLQSVTDAGNTTNNAISAGTVTANNELHLVNSQMRIFRSSDDMRIRTGNSDRMTITSTGNIGIGTTSPQQKLHVEGTIRIGADVDLSRYAGMLYTPQRIVLGAQNAENANITINTSSTYSAIGVRRPSSGTVSILKVRDYFTQDVYVDIDSDGGAYFNGSLTVNSTNNLGRITVNPTTDSNDAIGIDERGFIAFADAGTINTRLRGIPGGTFQFQGSSYDTFFNISKGGNSYLNTTSNFGIGTTSPDEKLHVQGGLVKVSNADNSRYLTLTSGTFDSTIASGGGGRLFLQSSSVMSLNTTNVGIGVSSPVGNGKLQVSGNAWFTNGNVGIGTTSPDANRALSVNGGISVSGYQSVFNSSILLNDSLQFSGSVQWGRIRYDNISSLFIERNNGTAALAKFDLDTLNVGIGTTSPTEKLEVSGNVKVSNGNDNISIIPNNSTGSISTTSQAVQGAIVSAVSDGFTFASRNVYGGVNIGSFNNAGTVTLGAFAYGNVNYQTAHNSFAHTWYGSRASDPWMTLNSTGLGIGTTSPAAKLDINGTTYLRSVALDTIFGYSGNNIQFINTGNTTFAGNVGIGTTAPSYPLVVKRTGSNVVASFEGDENTYLRIARTGTQSGEAQFRVTNTGNLSITSDSNISLTTGGVSGTTRLYVRNNDGNVGIGTTNPFAQLEIKKDSYTEARIRGNSDVYKHISLAHGGNFAYVTGSRSQLMLQSGDATYQYPMHFYTSGSARMVISPAGNVGIGTTSPDSKLQVNGTAMNQFRMQVPGGPSSNTDTAGREGDFAYDDQYLYVKTASGWGRVALDFGF